VRSWQVQQISLYLLLVAGTDARCGTLNVRTECRIRAVAGETGP